MASAAILAGGRATRFGGRDKSGLVVQGRTILARQIEELSALTDDILLIGYGDQAGRASPAPGVRVVPDRVADAGPLGGLDAALDAARHPVMILVACDMPYVSRGLLAYMVELAANADIVIPLTERGYHPLCAVYTQACRAAVARRLAPCADRSFDALVDPRGKRGDLRMTGLLEDVRVRVVEKRELERFGNTAQLLANVNTPAEFDELESLLGHKLKS